ncbi:hypothetical protein [Leuconostoc palmae]|uniref:hypothetical protein n=1 Tax=Leuconostoc palmae TaxID=501487 RepID=UPI001C7CE09D|nr:hypothetical protein [Leuconostoc palmae]
MQQGHTRYKQLSRARHEMALHNRCKEEGVWSAIGNVMTGIGNAISVVITGHLVLSAMAVGKQMGSALGIDKQMSAPNVDYDKFEIKDIATDMFRNNAGIVGYGKSQTL